jgi:hypothetical protein
LVPIIQLSSGKASLYQYFSKLLSEKHTLWICPTEQTIITKTNSICIITMHCNKIKKLKDLPAVFTRQQKRSEDFINKNSKNGPPG